MTDISTNFEMISSYIWGMVIALFSIVTMAVLVIFIINVGRQLPSGANFADTNCT